MMSGAEFEVILGEMKALRQGQIALLERVTALETIQEPIGVNLGKVVERLQLIERDFARINGVPVSNSARIKVLEEWRWRLIGYTSGAAMVGGALGGYILQLLLR